jgi:thymidylate kinase
VSIKRPLLISFSGLDGAGKSTQIENLRERLLAAGLRVKLLTFWDDVVVMTRYREGFVHTVYGSERGIGAPGKPVNRRDKNIRTWPMSCVRLGLYLLDAFATRRVVREVLRSGVDFVIFDRYIYDELANLNLRNPLMRIYARLIMKIVARPDVSYLLDADPLLARARKPEYPLEFIHFNRQSYLELCELLGGITVIPPMDISDVEREVLHYALGALSGSVAEREHEAVSMQRAS